MRKLIFTAVILVSVFSCSSLGTVSRGYSFSRQQIWTAINDVVATKHGGIKKITQDPPTAISKLNVKDKKFGIDKSMYQVYASLSGFERPYFVDVEVRVYPNGDETESYGSDRPKAQEVQDDIKEYLNNKRYNSTLQDDYKPY
ncbi:MAG: hypothetical protein V1647_05180 [Pseudomonadota bacterium]